MFTLQNIIVFIVWATAILIIIFGILFKIHPKRWWQQPYIIASLICGLTLFIYTVSFNAILTPLQSYHLVIKKLPIILLILSFAFISISLDFSGFFEYCATYIALRSKGNGIKLFINLFILISILTYFTSNDIVILTMTPIVIYVGRKIGIKDLVPFLLSQFFAANILSMGLYIGSPTNIVIADSLKWSFIDYSIYMTLPAIVSGATALYLSYLFFNRFRRNGLPKVYNVKSIDASAKFNPEMKVKVTMFFLLLLFLSLNSLPSVDFSIWIICIVFALIILFYDLFLSIRREKSTVPYIKRINERMPWGIIPFAISFFYLTGCLSIIGFSEYIGKKLIDFVFLLGNNNEYLNNFWGAIVFGHTSALFVNFMNDIPTSVFFSEILLNMNNSITPALHYTTVAGTLVGVNPGCNISLIGALAGLMWIHILTKLKKPGEQLPTSKDLTFYGLPIMFFVITMGCIVVWLQSLIFFKI